MISEPERPTIVTHRDQIRGLVMDWREAGHTVGIVPTMGALHEGHLSLVRASREQCDVTVVSIFVNPTQFQAGEDFQRYPRDLDRDLGRLASLGVHAVFAPHESELYAPTHSTFVQPPAVASRWEGACRPGHFRGVTTIVLKLFNIIPAEVAYFGQKDYQQSQVIRCMIDDLDIPVRMRVCPTIREVDGLAKSSRNAYLNPSERKRAVGLIQCLKAARELAQSGTTRVHELRRTMHETLALHGIDRVDYATVVDPGTMEELDQIEGRAVAIVAAHLGTTRLIDNLVIN